MADRFGSNCATRFENVLLHGGKYLNGMHGDEVDQWSFMKWRRSIRRDGFGEQCEELDLLATDKSEGNEVEDRKLDLSLHL